ELLDQLVAQVVDGTPDQTRAVIRGNELDASRQAGLELLELRLDRVDRLERILARTHDDHAARNLAFTIELGDAAAHFRANLYSRDVTETNRHAGVAGHKRNLP